MGEQQRSEIMSVNVRPFRWSEKAERAALMVAEDLKPDAEIAATAGITERQLRRWKHHPDFAARVNALNAAARAAVEAEGIANRQNRVAAYNDRWRRLQQVITERAADPALATIPGGVTGLIVATPMLVKVYNAFVAADGEESDVLSIVPKTSQLVYEYAVDTGLLKALLDLEKQAAQDLGQWTEKQEHSGEMLVREYVGIDPSTV